MANIWGIFCVFFFVILWLSIHFLCISISLEFFQINIRDAIQQKVHKVGKLVFPNAVKIDRGDRMEHLKKKIKTIDTYGVEVMTFYICDCEISSFENMSCKIVTTKNFLKN